MDTSWIPLAVLGAVVGLKLLSVWRSPGQLAAAARLLREQDGVLVDVRTPGEFASGHAPGAVNVPLGEVERHLAALGRKDRPVLVHCASGTRSMVAVRQLKAAGFTQVVDIGTLGNARRLPTG